MKGTEGGWVKEIQANNSKVIAYMLNPLHICLIGTLPICGALLFEYLGAKP